MFEILNNAMLGTIGRAILDFYMKNQVWINFIILFWGALMTFASAQLHKIRKMTVALASQHLKDYPQMNDNDLWESFKPKWLTNLAGLSPKLILNQKNLWVTKPSPENVINVLRLGPEWFGALKDGEILKNRGALPGEEYRLASKVEAEKAQKKNAREQKNRERQQKKLDQVKKKQK